MPVYEDQCKACGHEFEREQRISDAPVKKCPECGAMQAKRLISRTSFVLKGSGWYNDLYSSAKPGKNSADDKSSDSSPSGDSDAAKGESKGGGSDKGESKDGGSDKGESKKGSKKGAKGSGDGGAKGSKAA